MHCVALAANHEVWTTGVNDEGALGRPTGNEPKPQWPFAGKLCSHHLLGFVCCYHCVLVCRAASKIWENADVPLTDAYTWGKVDVPSLHGRVVQVAAGNPVMGFSPQFLSTTCVRASVALHRQLSVGFHWPSRHSSLKLLFCNLPLGIECVGHILFTVMQAYKLAECVPSVLLSCRRFSHSSTNREGCSVCVGHLQGCHWCFWVCPRCEDCSPGYSGLGPQEGCRPSCEGGLWYEAVLCCLIACMHFCWHTYCFCNLICCQSK